ncbi:type 1 glutamine amidotransferase [Natribaculum luteum]|uniref:Type 1 glutamine amidotransferase n=1 Tax=Natribaculum luteum TaxID=1586232 RepID=A0ABD5P3B0_9EURY|nr:type 1 glutamine amidotransferase [Natribaculum luteum]
MILVLDNEIKPDYRILGPEIARHLPDAEYYVIVDDPDHPPVDQFDGVVLSGSTDSVYDDHDEWFDVELELIDQCLDEEIPLLGVCYGHQIVNYALGGRIEEDRRRATFVEMIEYDQSDEGVLDGVDPVVPVLHGDLVTELGEGMRSVARTRYDDNFCSRHRDAPVWTVQFHPEFTEGISDGVSDWNPGDHSFDEVNTPRVFDNFARHCDIVENE